MPLSRLQYFGGAQEWRWQAISERDGLEDRGAVSSLLAVRGIVPSERPERSHPVEVEHAKTSHIDVSAAGSARMPSMGER